MFRAVKTITDDMPCKPHFETSQKTVPRKDSVCSTPSVCIPVNLIPSIAMSIPTSSGNSTPTSTRRSTASSISNGSNVLSSSSSSLSSTSASRPKRSSIKSSFKTAESITNRRSAPPSVRFLNPELETRKRAVTFGPTTNTRLMSKNRNTVPFTLDSSLIVSPPQFQQTRPSLPKRFSAPAQFAQIDPRWSNIPLPAHFTPPRVKPPPRIASYGSIISSSPTQSANAILSSIPPSTTTGLEAQYNPLQNHIPCLHPRCSRHYSPAHTGPTHYLPQEPYQLSQHQGYCPRHAARDLKEANTLCKAEWERMRQNAGRKTLGVIATEFDNFLASFRQDRREEARALEEEMKMRILGPTTEHVPNPKGKGKGKEPALEGQEWDWRYTPRSCTKQGCTAPLYSPYANFIHAFYTTRRRSTLTPLQTLCPSCSRAEIEGFEKKIMEKWNSRCGGWDEEEWSKWFETVVLDRDVEGEFWERAQERVVREKRLARKVGKENEGEGDVVAAETGRKEKRKSVFRKLFGLAV